MTNEQMMSCISEGKKCRRIAWEKGKYIFNENGRIILAEPGKENTFFKIDGINNPDRNALDWELYSPTHKDEAVQENKLLPVKPKFVQIKKDLKK